MTTPSKAAQKRPEIIVLSHKGFNYEIYTASEADAIFESLETELRELQKQRDHLLLQVQSQSMEMRTHKTTVHEIYQVLTGATGEPGNWNGAEPARKVMTELADTRRALELAVKDVNDHLQENRAPGVLSAEDYLISACKERGQ